METKQKRQLCNGAVLDLKFALDTARRLFHNSEQWRSEGEEYTPDGQTLDAWIDERFADVDAHIERLTSLLAECRDYVVNERDAQVLDRKKEREQEFLDRIDAVLGDGK